MLSSRTHLPLLPYLGWGCSTAVAEGYCPQRGVLSLPAAGFPAQLTQWTPALPIFFQNVHLLPLLLPLIYSGASLIDSSVKGQYITPTYLTFFFSFELVVIFSCCLRLSLLASRPAIPQKKINLAPQQYSILMKNISEKFLNYCISLHIRRIIFPSLIVIIKLHWEIKTCVKI